MHSRIALSGAVFLGCLVAHPTRAAAETCDRSCLEGFVNRYLAALVAQDPSKLPLAKNARYTENGQELKLGDGMWGPTVTLRNYKLNFADPQAGQVGFFGTIEEHGHPRDSRTAPEDRCPENQRNGSDRAPQDRRRVLGTAKPSG